MGAGQIGIITVGEAVKLTGKKLMTAELQSKINSNNGVVASKEVAAMIKGSGVGADNFTAFLPFACR